MVDAFPEAAEEKLGSVGLLERDLRAGANDVATICLEVPIRRTRDGPSSLVGASIRVALRNSFVMHLTDRNEGGKLRGAAVVIGVKVGDDEMIDFLQLRHLGRHFVNAARVAFEGIAGIDEDGFAGGSDDQSGTTSFDIDPVDIERAIRSVRRNFPRKGEGKEHGRDAKEGWSHGRDA